MKTTAAEVCWNLADKVEPSRCQETTEMLRPSNYLEIPELRLPRVFLDLAEESRNVKVENGQSCCSEEVRPQGTGLPRPVFVTVMVDSQLVPKKRVLRTTGASTEMIPNMNYAERREPVDRSGQVGPLGTTEQPVLLGLNKDVRGNASAGPGGPDVDSAGQSEPVGPGGPTEYDRAAGLARSEDRWEEKCSRGPCGP